MQLYSVNTGYFKLDGGAMFGVVPKTIWNKTNPADDKNLCSWAMRSLLIEDGNRLILIDTGMGDKQDDKFLSHYYLFGDDTLQKSLNKYGFTEDDITDVFLTHLHFDHCGGAIKRDANGLLIPAFKNAKFWSHSAHWNLAMNPNPREKASFLKENINPIEASGQLNFIDKSKEAFHKDIDILVVSGHTEAQMIPHISYNGKTVVFAADLLPSASHIPLSYVCGYDSRPLLTMNEKKLFLDTAANKEQILFLQHDPINECCTVQQTEKGVRLKEAIRIFES